MFSQVIRISFFNVKGLFIYLYTGCGCLAASFSGGTAVLLMSCPCYSTLGLLLPTLEGSIHPLGTYSVQSVGAAEAVSLAIGHKPGRVATPTQDTSILALILPTLEG